MFLSDPTTLKVTMGTSPTASCRFLRAPHPHTALWPAHVKLLLLESYITVLFKRGRQERHVNEQKPHWEKSPTYTSAVFPSPVKGPLLDEECTTSLIHRGP